MPAARENASPLVLRRSYHMIDPTPNINRLELIRCEQLGFRNFHQHMLQMSVFLNLLVRLSDSTLLPKFRGPSPSPCDLPRNPIVAERLGNCGDFACSGLVRLEPWDCALRLWSYSFKPPTRRFNNSTAAHDHPYGEQLYLHGIDQ